MGCDIHMHIEVKHGGVWHHFGHPAITRHYAFFAHFARCGRSEEIDPVDENRGVPEDMSVITRIDWERCDGECHSASWLDRGEIDELRWRWEKWKNEHDGGYDWMKDDLEAARFRTYLHGSAITDLEDTPYEDVRLVFWFDN